MIPFCHRIVLSLEKLKFVKPYFKSEKTQTKFHYNNFLSIHKNIGLKPRLDISTSFIIKSNIHLIIIRQDKQRGLSSDLNNVLSLHLHVQPSLGLHHQLPRIKHLSTSRGKVL